MKRRGFAYTTIRVVGCRFGRLAFVLALTLALVQPVQAQEEQVQQGLARGSARAVAEYFSPEVELNLVGSSQSLSNVDAEQQLARFFNEHPPTGFTQEHLASRKGSTFMIGTLVCGKVRYRLTALFRGEGASKRLFKLEIGAA